MKGTKRLISLAFIVFIISSCGKNDGGGGTESTSATMTVPSLITTNVLSITSYGAVSGGSIIDSSGSSIISRGICFSTASAPTLSNAVVYSDEDSSNFSVVLSGLHQGIIYHIRAFATNSTGTGYGNEISFKTTFAVGQSYQGGIIAYVDNRAQHGYIVAPDDIGDTVWGCTGTLISGADGLVVGTGSANTTAIVNNNCSRPGIAASLCKNAVINGYSDWYLPSHDELELIYLQKRAIDNFSDAYYWSSSQTDANEAYYINFATGAQSHTGKGNLAKVRPMRTF